MLSIVQSAFLAIVLIFIGYFLYREAITWNKLIGVAICLIGLAFINYKALVDDTDFEWLMIDASP